MTSKPLGGPRIGHLVLNVRDIEASHRFYTDAVGMEQCGELGEGNRIGKMRFYRGDRNYHHHLALVQAKHEAAEVQPWTILDTHVGINHIALAYPDRDTWLARLKQVQETGWQFLVRGNHGMTHSLYLQDPDGNGVELVYDLPNEVWEGDVNAALNYFDYMPNVGDGALEDPTDYKVFTPSDT
jgi:catechol-2,3-dioxygenase